MLSHPEGRLQRAVRYTIVLLFLFFLPSFLPSFLVFSLLLIYCCLLAFSDTTWHESNHHYHPSINQSLIDTILTSLVTLQVPALLRGLHLCLGDSHAAVLEAPGEQDGFGVGHGGL
jgi:hypothetical protein